MDGKFWLLLLIIVIAGLIAISILFVPRYARFKEKISAALKHGRIQLFQYWERLWEHKREFQESYSDLDAGQYGLLARKFTETSNHTQQAILASLQEQVRIKQALPRWEKASLKYSLGGIGRIQKWRKASQDVTRLQLSIEKQGEEVREVERALKALQDLPFETADLAKDTDDLHQDTEELLAVLSRDEGLGGKRMEESLELLAETKKELQKVPEIFYSLLPEELTAIPDIRSQTKEARRILEPASASLGSLNRQAKEWQARAEELRKTAVILEERERDTNAIFNRLNKSLTLSGEQEELSSLCQKADQVQADLAALTVEKLDPTLEEAKRILVGLALLNQTLSEYDGRLKKLQELNTKITAQLQAIDNQMKAASVRQEYPLLWTTSQTVFDDIQKKFTSIPPSSERRSPADLSANVETAEACDALLVKLQAATEKVVDDLEQLGELWVQLRPIYTSEWLAGVEQLFSVMKQYATEGNWEAADQAGTLYSDAEGLLKRANENIPPSSSMPVYEQQVGPRLLVTRDLAEKRPLFDARRARIETRLRQMQQEEQEALGLHKRIAPVVSLYAREIRSINIPTQHAQNMLAANVTRAELAKSLGQRNKGNITRKLEAVHAWERNAAENGAMVYRWVEEDLFRRKVSITASLQEIETFAEDLEDDIVVQAHQYELVYAPKSMDVNLIKKQPLDAIQNDSVKLFGEWQDVMECQGELRKFIAPVRDEHEKILAALAGLQENCLQLEKRLNRDWVPVFQTARYLRAKIDNLAKDIDGIRRLKWKRSELQKNYYFLWQKLRDLRSEADQLWQTDETEEAEFVTLDKEFRNAVRECARRVHAGNETAIRTEISAGETFIKSLSDQYRNGRKNRTHQPSAPEVRAMLQRKMEGYKQQLLDYNVTRMEDAMREADRSRQFMPTGREIPAPINRTEFITTLFRLITDLQKITHQHPDIEDAIEELRSAHAEARKSRPVSADLRRFMNSAKGILVEVEKTNPETVPVVAAITMLTGVIKNIFG